MLSQKNILTDDNGWGFNYSLLPSALHLSSLWLLLLLDPAINQTDPLSGNAILRPLSVFFFFSFSLMKNRGHCHSYSQTYCIFFLFTYTTHCAQSLSIWACNLSKLHPNLTLSINTPANWKVNQMNCCQGKIEKLIEILAFFIRHQYL